MYQHVHPRIAARRRDLRRDRREPHHRRVMGAAGLHPQCRSGALAAMTNGKGTKPQTKPAASAAARTKPAAKARAKPAPPAPAKRNKLTAEQLQPIATGHGACIASDKITVDGN